jgi:energy-coupling factor transporter transmembrane protein EcfT
MIFGISDKKPIRKLVRPIITVGLGLVLALFSAALTYSAPPNLQRDLASAEFFLQPTTTPESEDLSEIGSTDGIVVMGLVIALIIVIPILVRRNSWIEPQ